MSDSEPSGVDSQAAELFLYVADMREDIRDEFVRQVCAGQEALRAALGGIERQVGLRSAHRDTPASAETVVAAAALGAFFKALSEGDPPELARYAPDPAESSHERMLVELIKLDQKVRAAERQPKGLELYLREWPALLTGDGVVAELLRSECLSRAVFAASATPAELASRFGDVAYQIDLEQIEHLARPVLRVLGGGAVAKGLSVPERFSILRTIGKGGMGVVYEAIDRHRGMRVALKTLPRLDPVALFRFKREFRTLAGLAHQHLVPLYELISDGSVWFFTMELVEGIDFVAYVRPGHRTAADAPTGSAAEVAVVPTLSRGAPAISPLRACLRQLAEGVVTLHAAHILHRDLKPSNVLVRNDGHVVILDFGVAKEMSSTSAIAEPDGPAPLQPLIAATGTWTGDLGVVGSVPYMSPEQARAERVREASDWYSVGVMLYEALTGNLPFTGNSHEILAQKQVADVVPPNLRVEGVPDDLNDLCVALLRRDPAERPGGEDILRRLSPDHLASPIAGPVRIAAFVGREQELAALSAAFRELELDRAVTVHVRGRSGAGKTALVHQFLESLPGDVMVLAGRCYEQESVPYKALDSIVDALCRRLMVLSAPEVEALIPADIAALARIFPMLERIDSIRRVCRGSASIPDVFELRRRAFAALGEMLHRVGRVAPLVLFVDDLQWGDVDSAALLISFLDAASPPRLLLIACYRSEHADTNPCLIALNSARRRQVSFNVDVAPLLFEHTLQLATLLLQDANAATAAAERIARDSGGSPFFVYELARQAALGGPYRASGSPDLDETLWRRVLGLPAPTRHLLEMIAVAGKPLRVRSAFTAGALGERALSAVAALRAEHLVRTTGPGFDDEIETYHDRIRESVASHLSDASRTEHHRRLALALDAAHSPDVEATASHFHKAGLLDKAAQHYTAAGDNAAAALAFERSAELYGLALQVGHGSPDHTRRLRRKRADALANAGRGYEAGREYQRAAEGAPQREVIDLQCKAGYQYCVSGHIDEGREAFAVVLAHYGKRLPRTRRQALLSLIVRRMELRLRGMRFRSRPEGDVPKEDLERVDIFWSVAAGMTIADPIRGAEFQTHDLLLALRAGEPYRIARALAWEAAHISMTGVRLKRRTEEQLAAADRLAAQIRIPHATGVAKMSRGVAAYFHGDFAQCQRCCEDAASIFRNSCTGVSWELETCNAFAFWPFYFNGEYAELSRRFATLIAEVRERGARLAEADLTNFGGPFVWLAADDPEGARSAVLGVMGEWSRQDFQVQHFMTLTAEAQIDLYCGDAPAAWHRVVAQWAGLADAMLLHVEIVRIYMLHLRARCALAAIRTHRDRGGLVKSAEADARRLSREQPPYAKALATTIRAALAFERGDKDSAVALLGAAANELGSLGWGCFGVAARRRHGEVLGGEAGRRIVQTVDDYLAGQGVNRPDKLCAVQVPGFMPL